MNVTDRQIKRGGREGEEYVDILATASVWSRDNVRSQFSPAGSLGKPLHLLGHLLWGGFISLV